jgi:putative spermidine/putrescine transport system ATP-binding protein
VSLQLAGIAKSFGEVRAVHDIDLDVRPGEFFTLLGPSGCGKTTLLRVIAGIYAADRGRIVLNGRDITDAPLHRRNMALVFQNYALFPHLTAFDNVAFGLKMRRVNRSEIKERVEEALALVKLAGFGGRYPAQLSGGQQQRVALARALVIRPELLLLDEPLSNLDARLREEMRGEIRDMQRRLGIATVLVTHDIQEAFALSDRVAVLRAGRVEQLGDAAGIYQRPASRFVANFVGQTNELPLAQITEVDGRMQGRTADGLAIWLPSEPAASQSPCLILRPEMLRLASAPDGLENWFEAEIDDIVYLGGQTQCNVRLGAHRLIAMAPSAAVAGLRVGGRIGLGWAAEDGVVLDGR